MADRKYSGVYKKQGRWIVAWVKEISGANTQGRTLKEAQKNLHEALSLLIGGNPTISSFEEDRAKRKSIATGTA